MTTPIQGEKREYALLLQAPGKTQQLISRFLSLLLTYRYGLEILTASSFSVAYALTKEHDRQIRCTFVVLPKKADSQNSIASLSLDGDTTLFLVLPQEFLAAQKEVLHRLKNIHYCSWEHALQGGEGSLHATITKAFAQSDIGDLYQAVENLPYEQATQRIENRLKHLKTLPTLPEVALRIMEMVKDPQTSAGSLQQTVTSDPAIVHKLLQIVNSPLFAGTGHQGGWTLQESLVRLGRQRVGAIAQQVKLMNNLIKPQTSQFNLERFWTHSLTCAFVADYLVQKKLLSFETPIPFNDYWIGALLHDIGKLVLGFFFWSHFEDVIVEMGNKSTSFRQAEQNLGDVANHEYLGKLLLMKSRVGKLLVDAVSNHNTPGDTPGPLVCLVHVANELSKEMGKGYMADERAEYSPQVLKALKIGPGDMRRISSHLQGEVSAEIHAMVRQCVD